MCTTVYTLCFGKKYFIKEITFSFWVKKYLHIYFKKLKGSNSQVHRYNAVMGTVLANQP